MCVCVRGCVGAWVRMCASVCVEPRTIFGTQRNWQGVPTSFSNPAAFLGVWHRFPTSLCMRCLSGSRGVPTSIFYSLMMMFSTHWGTPQCYSPLKHINAITHYYTYIYIHYDHLIIWDLHQVLVMSWTGSLNFQQLDMSDFVGDQCPHNGHQMDSMDLCWAWGHQASHDAYQQWEVMHGDVFINECILFLLRVSINGGTPK